MAVVNGRIEPDFAHMERIWRDCMRNALTDIQAAKLAWAMWNYYLDGEEPALPKPAMLMFEAMRGNLDYRRKKSIEQLARRRGDGTPPISEDSLELCRVPAKDLKEICDVSAEDLKEVCEDSDGNLEYKGTSTCGYDEFTSRCPDGQREVNSHINNHIKTMTSLGQGLESGFDEGERARTPTLAEVRNYCDACGLVVSPEKFFNFFEDKGWCDKDGRPIRDWRALLRAWNGREGRYPEKGQAEGAGNGGDGRRRLNISCITSTRGGDKNEGAWFIQGPSEHAGLIPGSKGMSRDEAIRLAIELHPDLSDVVGK